MDYRRLGRSGLQVSELGLGTMTFRWTSTEEQSVQVLDRAWDAGINFIDTANVYSAWAPGNAGGVAEQIIGKWLRTKPRDQIVIATKVRARMWDGPNGAGLSRQHILAAVEGSLRRLNVDAIDLYQTHWPDWDTPLDETLRAGRSRHLRQSALHRREQPRRLAADQGAVDQRRPRVCTLRVDPAALQPTPTF